MRLIRFLGDDQRIHFGIPEDFPAARKAEIVHDPMGVLGAVDPMDAAVRRQEIFGGKRALIADDDENMRNLMQAILARAGCECCLCSDGEQAVRVLADEAIDLVVSDVVMPNATGYDVYVAAREQREDLPVVLVTGFGYEPGHALVRATREGLRSVLYKPFTPQQLLDHIKSAMLDLMPSDQALVRTGRVVRIERILAPLVPTTILCVGHNWHPSAVTEKVRSGPGDSGTHAAPAPDELEIFMKPRTAVQDPGGPIRVPDFDDIDPRLACEAELAVVIGRGGAEIPPSEALRHVLGYTIAGDVTARHFQTTSGPPLWMRGKGFDTFCPLGPCLVTADSLAVDDLTVRTTVNGRTIREGSTAHMIHSVAQIVSDVSRHITLEPGAVILTGAPPLVAADQDFDPTAELRPGDRVQLEVDGIGELVHPVIGSTS